MAGDYYLMVVIENVLKTLIDATSWAVNPEGLTKVTYVYIDTQKLGTDYKHPKPLSTEAKIVIFESQRSNKGRMAGANIQEYIGQMHVWTSTVDLAKLAVPLLDTIANGDNDTQFHIGGIRGEPASNSYLIPVIYQINKLETF
jgi:hypothetical protein